MRKWWFLLGLTALSAALRLIKLDTSFWFDEGYAGHLTSLSVPDILAFLRQKDIHPPLYFVLLRGWAVMFPTDLGLRLFSVLAGILTIPVFFGVCSKWFNHRVAWIATMLLTISPFHLHYSQEVKQYSLFILLSATALWLLITARQSQNPRSAWWLAFTLNAALLPYTHLCGLFVLVGLAACHLCLIWPVDRRWFLHWFGVYLLIGVLFVPGLIVLLQQFNKGNNLYNWLPQVSLRSLISTLQPFVGSPPILQPGPLARLLWTVPFMLLLILSMFYLRRAGTERGLALVALAVLPVLAISAYGLVVTPIFATRVLSPILLPLLTLLALPAGLASGRWRPLVNIITVIVLVFSAAGCFGYLWKRQGTDWRSVVQEIQRSSNEVDVIVVLPDDARYVFNYYHQGSPPTILFPSGTEMLARSKSPVLDEHCRVWVIRDKIVRQHLTLPVRDWIMRRRACEVDDRFHNLELIRTTPARAQRSASR